MLRRFLAKNSHKTVLVDSIYDAYARKSCVGTLRQDVDLSDLTPAPLPGDCGRAAWKSSETPSGAIGLLLQNTHLLGAAIDVKKHVIFAHTRADVNYMDMPFQLLRSTICEFAFDQVHFASSKQRTLLHTVPRVDTDTYHRAMRVDVEDKHRRTNLVHAVSTLSAVDQSALQRFGATDNDLCIFCGACKWSVHHCIFECGHPQLAKARSELQHPDEQHILDHYQLLPIAMLYGIPPKMALQPKGVWWSNEPLPQLMNSTVHPDVRSLFGISPAHDDADPFTRWLSPLEHLDARSAFRKLSGEGEVLPIPSLPAPVQGTHP